MSQSKFTVSAPAQRVYRVLGGDRPSVSTRRRVPLGTKQGARLQQRSM